MSEVSVFPGRVGLQQRVLPRYRVPFFEALARSCAGGLSVFAGEPRRGEMIESAHGLEAAEWARARNLHLLGGPVYACAQIGLLGWLETWNPDVLILEASARNVLNGWGRRWMHRRSRAVIGWGLGAPPPRGGLASWRRLLRARHLRGFDALIAYSTRGAESYLAEGAAPGRVFVAFNASLPASLLSRGAPPHDTGGAARILFVGRLQARKRVDDLLLACAGLEPAAEVWIVGDGPERQRLERLARRVCPTTRFFGTRHGADLDDLFARADLFVLPGTGGLALQEAMAHGLPVVAGEGDGTQRDLVRPGNGWLLREGSVEELHRVLRLALGDRRRLREMGRESRRVVAEEVNIEAMVRVFVRALRAVGGQGD